MTDVQAAINPGADQAHGGILIDGEAVTPQATGVPSAGQALRERVAVVGAKGHVATTNPAPTTSAAEVLAANPARKSATLRNMGDVDIYIATNIGVTASGSNRGYWLAPGGGFWTDEHTLDAWYAVTASGTGDLSVTEEA